MTFFQRWRKALLNGALAWIGLFLVGLLFTRGDIESAAEEAIFGAFCFAFGYAQGLKVAYNDNKIYVEKPRR
jgi:hypothetical protein